MCVCSIRVTWNVRVCGCVGEQGRTGVTMRLHFRPRRGQLNLHTWRTKKGRRKSHEVFNLRRSLPCSNYWHVSANQIYGPSWAARQNVTSPSKAVIEGSRADVRVPLCPGGLNCKFKSVRLCVHVKNYNPSRREFTNSIKSSACKCGYSLCSCDGITLVDHAVKSWSTPLVYIIAERASVAHFVTHNSR